MNDIQVWLSLTPLELLVKQHKRKLQEAFRRFSKANVWKKQAGGKESVELGTLTWNNGMIIFLVLLSILCPFSEIHKWPGRINCLTLCTFHCDRQCGSKHLQASTPSGIMTWCLLKAETLEISSDMLSFLWSYPLPTVRSFGPQSSCWPGMISTVFILIVRIDRALNLVRWA